MFWFDAMDFCQRHNMTGARIDSAEENEVIFNFLNSTFGKLDELNKYPHCRLHDFILIYFFQTVQCSVTNRWFWLGAMDYGSETEYYWFPSGDKLTYENWTSDSQLENRPP